MKYFRVTSLLFRARLRHIFGWCAIIFAPVLLFTIGSYVDRDVTASAYATVPLAVFGTVVVPHALLSLRETGILQRFLWTPLKRRTFFCAAFTVDFVLTTISIVSTLAVGWIRFHQAPSGNIYLIIGAILLSTLAFLALGVTLAWLYRSITTTNILGNLFMIVLIVTSGVITPPPTYTKAIQFSPLWQTSQLFHGLWHGQDPKELLVPWYLLIGMIIVFGFLGIKFFTNGNPTSYSAAFQQAQKTQDNPQ